MASRTGIRVHAYALIYNHYNFVIETPEGNLVGEIVSPPVQTGGRRL